MLNDTCSYSEDYICKVALDLYLSEYVGEAITVFNSIVCDYVIPDGALVWQPFEYYDAQSLAQVLTDCHDFINSTISHVLDAAKSAMIEDAINCKFPEDLNELDMTSYLNNGLKIKYGL